MGAIKVKDPEQEPKPNQESPSKEIIDTALFIIVVVIIAAILYNAFLYYTTPDNLFAHVYQFLCFAIVEAVIITYILVMLLSIAASYFEGNYDDWLKQNIDPHLLKIKSWLNRRNEQ